MLNPNGHGAPIKDQLGTHFPLTAWSSTTWAALLLLLMLSGCTNPLQPTVVSGFTSSELVDPEVNQTLGGYQLSVQKVYAANGLITVCLTFSGEQVSGSLVYLASLSDDAGNHYPPAMALGSNQEPGADIVDISFDASAHGTRSITSILQLALDVYKVDKPRQSANGGVQRVEVVTDTGQLGAVSGNKAVKVAGTFNLDLGNSSAINPAQSRVVAQSSATAGITLTLERVVISPDHTSLYLKIAPPEFAPDQTWFPGFVTMSAGTWKSLQLANGAADCRARSRDYKAGTFACTFDAPLYGEVGQWSVQDDEAFTIGPPGTPNANSKGSWQFNFSIPPTSTQP